ncbi:MAG: hypothetical protein CME61_02065 [Halobacteriovoraceae bacterium]|nr:hypothetical protein [Halobacteriovoraceae bacterium]|tara:strand:- start:128 stop:346 length:219 start_codon:yes stop_codon:yes gene_type:complete
MNISLDKIASKTKVKKNAVKKPWESSESSNDLCISPKRDAKKGPRFQIPESNRKKLSELSDSVNFLFDIMKV